MAAQHDRDPGAGQVGETGPPARRGRAQGGRAHPVHGRLGMEDARVAGQGVLRGRDDQVESLDRRPGPADMHQLARTATAGLTLDPAGDRLVAPAGRDDELGPGWHQLV